MCNLEVNTCLAIIYSIDEFCSVETHGSSVFGLSFYIYATFHRFNVWHVFGAEIFITYLLQNALNCKSQDQFLIQYNNIRSLKSQFDQTQLWALVWTCQIGWINNCKTIQETCTVEFFDSKVSLKAELLHLLFKHFPSWFSQNFEQQKKLSFISAIYRGSPTSTVSTSMISTNTIVSLFMNMLAQWKIYVGEAPKNLKNI